jgi:hypothetical protein
MLRTVFILEALLDLAFGVALIAATGTLLGLYGMATDEAGTFLGRFLGATFVGFGIINWFAASWPDGEARRLIVRTDFVTSGLGFLVALDYQLQPGTPPQSWAIVVLTLAFTVAWGYFAIVSNRPRRVKSS